MNAYVTMKQKHQAEVDAFPFGAAFSNKQFEEMMLKFGLTIDDTDKICSLGAGVFIRKTDKDAFWEMMNRQSKERSDAIAADKNGDGFIYDMFLEELANHEYCITYDYDETLDSLDLTYEEVKKDNRLLHGLQKATKAYLKNCKQL